MPSIIDEANATMREAGLEIRRLRRAVQKKEDALQYIADSGLLVGPTELHEKARAKLYAALGDEL